MTMRSLEDFRRMDARYDHALKYLEESSEILSISARTVFENHGDDLLRRSDEILGFLENRGPADFMERYVRRVEELQKIQKHFNENPSLENLRGTVEEVERVEYDIALLLSFLFSDHRREILLRLLDFLRSLAREDTGHRALASIGAGTGYELYHASRALPGWSIRGYDINADARRSARSLLDYLRAYTPKLKKEFPLDAVSAEFIGAFDAIMLCEILEHLPDPARALSVCARYLNRGGKMFITMAVNIAQEDHIYWYDTLDACRSQVREAGLAVEREWTAPVSLLPRRKPLPEAEFTIGNYIAIVHPNREKQEEETIE